MTVNLEIHAFTAYSFLIDTSDFPQLAWYAIADVCRNEAWIEDVVLSHKSMMIVTAIRNLPKEKVHSLLTPLLNTKKVGNEGRLSTIVFKTNLENCHDLRNMAEVLDRSPLDIIEEFTQVIYEVSAIGFMPGFPYLSGLPEALHFPRKNVVKKRVPKSSIGIGKNMAGIYPMDSPGGWNIIGKTALSLFPFYYEESLLKVGDKVKFYMVEEEAFAKWCTIYQENPSIIFESSHYG